jgi:hypothetical protein
MDCTLGPSYTSHSTPWNRLWNEKLTFHAVFIFEYAPPLFSRADSTDTIPRREKHLFSTDSCVELPPLLSRLEAVENTESIENYVYYGLTFFNAACFKYCKNLSSFKLLFLNLILLWHYLISKFV